VKLVRLLIILTLSLCSLAVIAADRYPFSTPVQRQQFDQLTGELRCLVCQNEDLASSTAPLAADLRQEIYRQIKEGKSNQTIIQYMVKRYGDFVLFKPPFKASTYFLWVGPFLFLVIGFIVLMRFVRRSNK